MREKTERLGDLVERVRGSVKSLHGVYWELYQAWVEGRLEIEDPRPPESFWDYLRRPDYSSWFWAVVFLVVLTVVSIHLSIYSETVLYMRYVLGSVSVLFLPGYLLVETLYPSPRDLGPLERLALSIGLSLAVVPLIGLLLNYSPWGIRLEPVVSSMTIYDTAMALAAGFRKYSLVKMRSVLRGSSR